MQLYLQGVSPALRLHEDHAEAIFRQVLLDDLAGARRGAYKDRQMRLEAWVRGSGIEIGASGAAGLLRRPLIEVARRSCI